MTPCSVQGCDKASESRDLCGRCYARWQRHGDPAKTVRRSYSRHSTLEERLIEQSDRSGGPNSCWPWAPPLSEDGYARFTYGKRFRPAHVWSYVLVAGEPPSETPFVLHSCDNRSCINPNHLRTGTHQENMEDMKSRNRQARENLPWSRLDWPRVREIRAAKLRGVSIRDLAATYEVCRSNIEKIVNNRYWFPDPESK